MKAAQRQLLGGDVTQASCPEAHRAIQLLHLPSQLGNAEDTWKGRGRNKEGKQSRTW